MFCGSTDIEGLDDEIGHLGTGKTLLTASHMIALFESTDAQDL